jgi:hypothetical protein
VIGASFTLHSLWRDFLLGKSILYQHAFHKGKNIFKRAAMTDSNWEKMEVCKYTNVQDCHSEELRNSGKCQECEVFEKLRNFKEILKKAANENKEIKWYIMP